MKYVKYGLAAAVGAVTLMLYACLDAASAASDRRWD